MTKSSHGPGTRAVPLDDLSKLEETIMSGEVTITLIKSCDTFKELDGTPTDAMLQRLSEALDMLHKRQNVPAPPTSAPQPDAVSTSITVFNKPGARENVPARSTSTPQPDAVSTSTTALNKPRARENAQAPSTSAPQSHTVSTSATASTKPRTLENALTPKFKSDAKSAPSTALASEAIRPLDEKPRAKASTADYTVMKAAFGAIAAPLASAAASYWQSKVVDSRAELARVQQAEAKATIAAASTAEKASARQDQLFDLGTTTVKAAADIVIAYVKKR